MARTTAEALAKLQEIQRYLMGLETRIVQMQQREDYFRDTIEALRKQLRERNDDSNNN